MELQLDWQKQKGGVRRALFLASKQATLTQTLLIQNGAREDCREMKIYLRVWPEDEGGLAWVDGHIKQRTLVVVERCRQLGWGTPSQKGEGEYNKKSEKRIKFEM